jgi:NAD(P)-dependent dehydrogenase (short-subunit alcohol dehydrogenase family)
LKTILIAGATGRQGQATIRALAPSLDDFPEFRVLALTRDPNSATCAKCFNGMEHVTVVQGNLDSENSMRAIFEAQKPNGGIWGVFCVLPFPGLGANADGEEKQGKVITRDI